MSSPFQRQRKVSILEIRSGDSNVQRTEQLNFNLEVIEKEESA